MPHHWSYRTFLRLLPPAYLTSVLPIFGRLHGTVTELAPVHTTRLERLAPSTFGRRNCFGLAVFRFRLESSLPVRHLSPSHHDYTPLEFLIELRSTEVRYLGPQIQQIIAQNP